MSARRVRQIIAHPSDPTLALVPLTKGHFAVISAVDAEAAGRFNWQAHASRNGALYARRRPVEPGAPAVEWLHRLVGSAMGLSLAHEVDHENRNGLDCRRSNLRDATGAENRRNATRRIDNTSGVKGVGWSRKRGKWCGRLRVDGRRIYVGFFDHIEDAAVAMNVARVTHHSSFASDGDIQ